MAFEMAAGNLDRAGGEGRRPSQHGGRAARRALMPVVGWAALWACAAAAPARSAGAEDAAASFDRSTVPAAGRSVVHLQIPSFGRWSVAARSAAGASLQLVDRMAGPGPVSGVAGVEDGRVDGFLDRGTVRVVVDGGRRGRGEIRLEARRFVAAEPVTPSDPGPRLLEGRLVSSALGDLEERSWWIELPQRRRVVLEAGGRHLADLRLWQNGAWLVDASPREEVVEPRAGQPLRLLRLTADLPAGLYRLVAYGGPGVPWAMDPAAAGEMSRPLHLRWGIPRRGVAAREAMRIGPLGFERFLVPGRASYYRLEVPRAERVSLELAAFEAADPFAEGESWAMDPAASPPVIEIWWAPQSQPTAVTVRGPEGQAFVLQHLEANQQLEFTGKGKHWIGTVSAGSAADALDATGVLFARRRGAPARVVASQAVPLSSRDRWARRFNLPATATLVVDVREAGAYELRSRGVEARFRIEPLLAEEPAGYRQPPLRSAPLAWDLGRGLHVLTMEPSEPGVAEVALRPRGAFGAAWDGVGAEPSTPRRGAIRLGVVPLEADASYTLWLAERPGVVAGAVARALPLDLDLALPLELDAGEVVEIPSRARQASLAWGRREDGGAVEFSLDGRAWSRDLPFAPGERVLRVRLASEAAGAPAPGPVALTVGLEPASGREPLGRLAPEALGRLPEFPRLVAGGSRFQDAARGETTTFLVDAPEPGLYSLRTRGLLAMEGALRTRVEPRLREGAENAAGRNVALRAYLGEGEYQATVAPRGASAGRFGVELERTPVRDAGSLQPGETARLSVGAEEAVVLRLTAPEAGRYRVRALALDGFFDLRLEDGAGWPVAEPVVAGDLEVALEPGAYRALVLPRGIPGRALVRWDHHPEPPRREGHGPHPVAVGGSVDHVWTEPEDPAADRPPDRFHFSLPAAANLRLEATGEMEGELVPRAAGAPAAVVGRLRPGRALVQRIPAGDYEVRLRGARRNHLQAYRLSIESQELLAGQSVTIEAPAALAVAIGAGAAGSELGSFGSADVRARLIDASGQVVAASDDRADGWDFLLGGRLEPGVYTLRVDPVGRAAASTTVTHRTLEERPEPAWEIGATRISGSRELDVAGDVHWIPLRLDPRIGAAGPGLLVVGATASEPLALRIESRDPGGAWRERARDEGREAVAAWVVPPDGTGAGAETLRVAVRSLEGRATRPRLDVWFGDPPLVDAAAAARGVPVEALEGFAPPFAAARVEAGPPGCFAVAPTSGAPSIAGGGGGEGSGWRHARRAGAALVEAPGWLVAGGRSLWIGRRIPASADRPVFRAERVLVGSSPGVVRLDPGESVVCDVEPARRGAGRLLVAQAPSGQPVVRAVAPAGAPGTTGTASSGRRFDEEAAIAPGRAIAWAAPADRALEARNGGDLPIEARLAALDLVGSPAEAGAGGAAAGETPPEVVLAPGSVRVLTMPGRARLDLSLDTGAAVAHRVEGRAAWLVWAAERPRQVSVETRGTEILAINPLAEAVRVRWRRVPPALAAAEEPAAAAHDAPFLERRFDRAGAVRLQATPPDGAAWLELSGATDAHWVSAEGEVAWGARLAVPPGPGTLVVEHPRGLVEARFARADGSEIAAPGSQPGLAVAPRDAALPASIALAGGAGAARLAIAAPSVLVWRGATPMALAIEQQGVARARTFPGGVEWSVPVRAGEAIARWRGLAGEPLHGVLAVESVALEPASEGIGPTSLLEPGGARAVSFALAERRLLGIGARSTDGRVEAELFRDQGGSYQSLGSGAALWRELAEGDYLLVVRLPATGRPARVEPVFVGLEAPPDGPPDEVIRALVESDRPAAPRPGAVEGAEDLGPRGRAPSGDEVEDEGEGGVEDDGWSEGEEFDADGEPANDGDGQGVGR